ncbi:MAG: TonB-dependent receptor [Hyphomonadaceae bacterium]
MADYSTKTRWGWTSASLTALAMAIGLGGGAAYAQDVAEEEEIVITGFRGSLAAAIDIKRDEVAAVDAIVAEDIADMPDANLSESIQRIPGVAITRANGEGRQITVRGLGPQFTRVRLNGMEAMSATGSTDAEGGTNRGRNFDFNVFASELFNNITVRKTASAEIEEGSLGATVDLRTARPFDYDGFTLAASGQVGYNDLSESYDPRFAFLISNTWGNDSFGALFSFAFADRESLEEGASTVRWQNGGNAAACVTGAGPNFGLGASCFGNVLGQTEDTPAAGRGDFDAVNSAFHPRIPRYDIYEHTQDRLGATLTLQYRPTNSTDITLDVLYADHDVTRSESFLEAPVFSTNGASAINAVDVLDYEIQGGTLVYGVFDDVDIRSEYRFDEASSQLRQVSLTLEHEFSEDFRASAFIGRSDAEHDNPTQTTILWDRTDVDGYSYDYRGNNRLPVFTYGGLNVADPSIWTLTQIRLRPQFVDNTYETAYGDLEFDLNETFTLRGGLNWKTFEFTSVELRRSNGTTANLESVIPGFAAATPTSSYSQIVTLNGSGLDIPAGLVGTYAAPNINLAASLWDLYNRSVFPMGIEPALGNNYSVEEEDFGGYVQLEWDAEIAGMPFRGNIGVRQVTTDQTATGYTFASGAPLLQTTNRSYDDTLPSLNMVLEPMDDVLLRFGAADVMTRPGLGQLNPGATVSVSGSNKTVTAGNPELDPFRARAYDIAVEWYFHDEALLSFAYFYKDIDSFVQTVRETGPFTGNSLGLPDSVAIAACGPAFPATCAPSDNNWQFTLPRNTPGGPVEGFEISLQLPFYFLGDSWLSNFGIVANYTHVESEIDYVNATGAVVVTDDLTGLSGESWNTTLYYEGERFAARISGAYRSDYLTTIPGRNGNTSESTAETFNVDFSSSYQFNDNLTFTFEGLNLTDEVSDQFLSPDDRTSFYHHYGSIYSVGLRFTY